MGMDQINWQQRRDVLLCIICMGFIVWTLWILVNQFIDAIFLLLLSMAVAFLITPVVNALEKRGIPRLFSTITAYVLVIAIIGLFSYLLVISFVNQVTVFSDTIVAFTQHIPDKFSSFLKFLRTQAGIPQSRIDQTLAQLNSQATDFANAAVTNAISVVFTLTTAFLNLLIVIVVSFYLTLDGKRIRDNMVGILPKRSLPTAMLFEDALSRVVGNYIRGQLILAVIIGVLVGLICSFVGLGDFAVIFGVLGFLFETIPMIGPGLASISPVIVSLLLPDPFPRTLILIVCFLFIQILESNILGPRIVGHAVGLHPVVSIMSLFVFASLFGSTYGAFGGAVGALVATPIVAAAWVVIASLYRSAHGETADQMLAHKRAPWVFRRPSPVAQTVGAGSGSERRWGRFALSLPSVSPSRTRSVPASEASKFEQEQAIEHQPSQAGQQDASQEEPSSI